MATSKLVKPHTPHPTPCPFSIPYLDCKTSFGLKVHATLGVSPVGIALGLINQYVWAREEKNLGIAKLRKKRETQWLNSLSETQQQIPEDIQVVTIGDCEADI